MRIVGRKLKMALLLAAGLAGAGFGDVKLGDAPAAARARQNPYAGVPEAALAGKKLFKQHCATCHGADGFGKGKAPGLRSSKLRTAAPGELFWFLRNGDLNQGMPAWSRLPDQQVWQLVTYLESLR